MTHCFSSVAEGSRSLPAPAVTSERAAVVTPRLLGSAKSSYSTVPARENHPLTSAVEKLRRRRIELLDDVQSVSERVGC